MEFKDYYSILKIRPDSDRAEIKNAYRKLVNLHHPDKHPRDSGDAAPFLDIREAYDVLSDPGKRKEYDRIYEKEMNINKRSSTGFAENTGGFGEFRHGHEMDDLMDELYRRFFGSREKSSRRRPGEDSGHIHYDDLL